MPDSYYFTSESVTEGHPDKVADAISDAILDAIMAQDKRCRVACETLVTTGMAVIAGEITTDCYVDMPQVVRETIRDIGYHSSQMGFDWQTCAVLTSIDHQSPDIAQGVNQGEGLFKDQGAGDQGLMFGFASDETEELMPMPITYAHKLTRRLAKVRKNGALDFLRPDGKAQVTIEYENGTPKRVDTIVIAAQHKPDVTYDQLREAVIEEVIKKVIPKSMIDGDTRYFINSTGKFVIGGPMGDCGLTGRKIIVDTYGGQGSHGGGCFSGKDPSKVDRSASYMARHVAKNIVAAGLAKKCEVQMAYAIGVAEPVSILVDMMGTGKIPTKVARDIILDTFDLRPAAIIEYLDLLKPIFHNTAAYGHFGRNEPGFTWEETHMAETLRNKAGV
ncbi:MULTISPECIES: methionine adenosyltransferase [Desulfococcus]|jgi:S-adenosylmethionine synthetase|uniref:S-adenosylmethionine synthase n=1 Tax=Desulfococcus multivorans DSM 2059 TaxID=1121405 RepID=S7TF37_DESML|nr:methionine adenosyltransferase [Desulfococcus multivorans]AOY58661.1 MetK: S-adenosylmethionine synthase [Desulfococcus multivorans]AQV00952.1 methionine adenosyltransferase [Desulfococcus multivorans]EPR35316.1 S-adenosylmethionine synthase [Desulfococcus multivorans DSM 2059]MDX9819768.1 methionine adenosyltransferase [Desulfococcus multivorans]SJZ45861.1 methionine adenosyltransferase [Desulfococcus multivorans DSM 2059]